MLSCIRRMVERQKAFEGIIKKPKPQHLIKMKDFLKKHHSLVLGKVAGFFFFTLHFS